MVIGSFRYRNRTMTSLGLWNYQNTYCFRLSLNFLYWSLAFLWLYMAPNTSPKTSSSPFMFQIDDLYAGRLKRPPHITHHWWPLLTPQPLCPCSWPHLILLYSIMVLWTRVGCCVTFPVTSYRVWWFHFCFWILDILFLKNVELTLLFSFHVGHNWTWL